MTDFVLVVKGEIVQGPGRLPASWVDAAGTTHSAVYARPADELAALGWLPVVEAQPVFDERTEYLVPGDTAMVNGVPTRSWEPYSAVPERIAAVKAEAYNRILAVAPMWKQNNLLAQATQLLLKGMGNWTKGEQAAWEAGSGLWARTVAIRAASDAMEKEITASGRASTPWPE